jgi:membrane protease YdiL (CAAX protease family)
VAGDPGHRQRHTGAPASLTSASRRPADLQRAGALAACLLVAAALRALVLPPLGEPAAGLLFALVLVAAAVLASPEVGNLRPAALILGTAAGAALLLPGLWLHWAGLPSRAWFIPAPTLAGYSAALLVMVPAEELFLRGALQPTLRRALGPGAAITVTAVLFAAIHMAAYGLVAIPLDFGVGLLLGWLRERTGSTAACAIAHLVADLGSWWLP